ncbi:nucleotidyl transferase [Paramagnetospirillum kuznetsovii]|uniref:Nucleotidyl transferase n=1 Tax=Paramagnetospirillum kuznetsovii TaxID=2053833 RepID=A0A364NXU1_9PROT|nr:nucleotidyltransferase family protein [Paramagnetospirillum kuznetsovii]RAU21886.1 nucleotidyl transferase [Paramagnetospirillum kuznetsovii]
MTESGDNGLGGIDVVVLAGGLGTRIRSVLGDIPKVLAPINGRPFLDHLLDHLAALGAGRVVLSLGVGADQVRAHLDGRDLPLQVLAVAEPAPLGTGGALRHVMPRLVGDPVMVMNGDTWLEADFAQFLAEHRRSGRAVSLLCVAVAEVSRYGRVEIAADGQVTRFAEKDPTLAGPGWINGGAALLSRPALDRLAAETGPSLERDFLAQLPPGWIFGWRAEGAAFIDIGTPESLAEAGNVLPHDAIAAKGKTPG